MMDARDQGQGSSPVPPANVPGRPEAAGSLLAFLAEASAVLAASLDYETTLATIARLAVPFLADWCAVDVRPEDSTVRRVAVAHTDPARIEQARELERRYPFDPEEPHGLARVLRTGQAEFFPEITDDMLAATARTPEQLAALRQLGLHSALLVPLVACDRVLGAITLATAESGRRYTAADLAVAEDLARRCALAVDNARLYREARAAENRYRDLVDGMDAIVWEADAASWQFTFVSRHAEALLGYPVERWLNEPNFWVNLIHPDDRERAVAACREATEQGRDHTFEYRALAADGRVVWLRDLVYVVRDEAGKASRLRGLMVDISDRKQAEDELRDRERYLRAVFDEAMDAFVVTDDQGRYVEVNPAACELFGLPREQLLGRRIADFAEEGFRFDRAWHHFRKRGRDKGEFRLTRPDGEVRHLAYAATADFLPGRHLSVLRDITDRKELEDDLRERALELAQAARLKDDFIAALAHELRNPLGPIRNALQVLRLRPEDRAAVEWARDLAERQIGHLSHLVDDLLDVSRLARGKINLRPERIDLVRLVRMAAEDHRPGLEAVGLRLVVETPDAPLWVQGDATRLAQVMDNLLSNAGKFTPAGGTLTVSVTLEAEGRQAAVRVRDTGMGIDPALVAHLFEAGTQADHSLERTGGGLGLGLALVKGLVDLHGGRVAAASAGPGQGAVFTFWLPQEGEPAPLTAQPAAPTPARRTLRILMVEDNRDAAESLRLFLQLSGHEVTVAHTGPAGVEAARRFHPDVVLCDIGLPGMDGYSVAGALRHDRETARTRLIALTGYGQEEDRRRAFAAGFDVHLTKPVDPADLQRVLTEAGTKR